MSTAFRASGLFVIFFFCCITLSFAQPSNKTNQSSPSYSAELFFNTSINQQSRLFNGIPFQDYFYNVLGSANFNELTSFTLGTIIYDGSRFDSIPLMYNLHLDKVIVPKNELSKYSLISAKVSDFYLNDHHFKYIAVADTTTSIIKPGFFEMIFEGNSNVLAKKTKTMYEKIENQRDLSFRFSSKTTYYLERDKKYYLITGEASFLNHFKDKKDELKKHLKENKIKFRRTPEDAMALLAKHYETLVR